MRNQLDHSSHNRLADRIIDKHERRKLVPYSDTQVWRLENAGAFPKRIKLGEGRVGWSFNEIQDWIHRKRQASK